MLRVVLVGCQAKRLFLFYHTLCTGACIPAQACMLRHGSSLPRLVNGRRKGTILVLDSPKVLSGFFASGSLRELREQTRSTVLSKGVLHCGNPAVGWDEGGRF